MNPNRKAAGLAGILTGLLLAGEFFFFMLSNYSPAAYNNANEALAILTDNVNILRAAVLFGIAGAIVRIVYVAGLAAVLYPKAPSQAVAVKYFGILGGIGHGLVALTFFSGLPVLVTLAAQDAMLAQQVWHSFTIITSGFQSLGNTLLGLFLLVSGFVIVRHRVLSSGLGWVGIAGGVATLIGVFSAQTAFSGIGFMAFMTSLPLAVIFNIWSGIKLYKLAD